MINWKRVGVENPVDFFLSEFHIQRERPVWVSLRDLSQPGDCYGVKLIAEGPGRSAIWTPTGSARIGANSRELVGLLEARGTLTTPGWACTHLSGCFPLRRDVQRWGRSDVFPGRRAGRVYTEHRQRAEGFGGRNADKSDVGVLVSVTDLPALPLARKGPRHNQRDVVGSAALRVHPSADPRRPGGPMSWCGAARGCGHRRRGWVSPSLQSRATLPQLASRRVTTGSVWRPPIALESVCASLALGTPRRVMTPEIDQLLRHGLVAGDLGQLALLEEVAAAVAHLEQVGAGPHAQVERERGGHAAIFGILLAPAQQLPVAAECRPP